MRKNIKKFLIILFLLVCCCKTSRTKDRIALQKTPENLQLTSAYLDYANERIYLKQTINGRRYVMTGEAKNLLNPKHADTGLLGDYFIKLDTMRSEDRFAEVLKNKKFVVLKSLSKEEYEKTIEKTTHDVIAKLVPKKKNKGIVLSFRDEEVVFYRDKHDDIQVVKLLDKPSQVEITEYYSKTKYREEVFKRLEKQTLIKDKIRNDFLLFEASSDIMNYSAGILDFKDNEIYYFDYSVVTDLNKTGYGIEYPVNLVSSFAVKSHFITPLKNPVTSTQKFLASFWRTSKKVAQDRDLKKYEVIPPLNTSGEKMDMRKFDELLDDKVSQEVYKAKVNFLIDGEEFFPDFIKSIEDAKKYINLRIYIFDNDDYAVKIADLLKKKSIEDGAHSPEIKILKDSLANITQGNKNSEISANEEFETPGNMKRYLKHNSNIKVRTTPNVFLTFDHTKSLIFDDKVVYVGGMNIGKEYRYSWHDMMAKLEGPIAKPIKKEFDKQWSATGWGGDAGLLVTSWSDEHELTGDEEVTSDMIDVRLLYTKPGNRDIYKAQILAIKNAKKYIYIENPYLSDTRIVNELILARQRGVDVRVIVPERNNIGVMHSNNMALTNVFIENGIRVYHYPAMTHVKVAIYDGWACLGSANFDKLSFDKNIEMNIAFSDPETSKRLQERLFEKDFAISKEITQPIEVFWVDQRLRGLANYL